MTSKISKLISYWPLTLGLLLIALIAVYIAKIAHIAIYQICLILVEALLIINASLILLSTLNFLIKVFGVKKHH
ncbi:hypothetical protein BDD43_5098 [Mucilaginibacter gracilis]|uniref:Uncharacterized protein n=1 Tax=Mucilaginibacter gracilis TaxID=423350 RepID=A0A495J776_9SPHI|nr:hypothetical protein BDD43_5098 [Mucilaginibacter gracilis]